LAKVDPKELFRKLFLLIQKNEVAHSVPDAKCSKATKLFFFQRASKEIIDRARQNYSVLMVENAGKDESRFGNDL
jgi:hypothetical protein